MGRKTGWSDGLSAEALMELQQAGSLLSQARRSRRLSASGFASRLGIDRRTLTQLEKGSPTVSLGVFFQALSVLNLLRGVSELLRPENDIEAIAANVRRLRQRRAPAKPIPDEQVDF